MSNFNPEKLFVEFKDGVTATAPVTPRLYTLTHTDSTRDLFLTIGLQYAWENINWMRDEVLAEWKLIKNSLYYCVYLYIDQGQYDFYIAQKRNDIFRRELPLALTAIRYGDRLLFKQYPNLDHTPIIINFMSAYPPFARQECWGDFSSYKGGI